MRYLPLPLLFILALANALANGQSNIEDLIAQLSGKTPAPERTDDQLHDAYTRIITHLLPGIAAEELVDRKEPQLTFERICFHAGRPGAERERAALCTACLPYLDPETPKPARVWFLRQLIRLSGPESVDAVGAVLADDDPEIRDLARRVLQNNPARAADAVLAAALRDADDAEWKIALINALAARATKTLGAQIATLQGDMTPAVATAAIAAFGDIGPADPAVTKVLEMLWDESSGKWRDAIADTWLRWAHQLNHSGQKNRAAEICRRLYSAPEVRGAPHIRIASLRGLVAAQQAEAVPTALQVITDPTEKKQLQLAAADCIADIPDPAVTKALTEALTDAAPAAQVLILRALEQRGDTTAITVVMSLLDTDVAEVCIAALRTLREIGNANIIRHVAQTAATSESGVQDAARTCLARLRGENVDSALLAHLQEADPSVQVELIHALAQRYYYAARPTILTYANATNVAVAQAALTALATLGTPDDIPAVLNVLLHATAEPVRTTAESTAIELCESIPNQDERAAPILTAWPKTPTERRPTLVRILGRIHGEPALEKLRALTAASANTAPDVLDAAVRALANWPTTAVLDDLLDLARECESRRHRVLALRGYLRLLELPADRDPAATVDLYHAALLLADADAERRLVLSGLAHVRHHEALALVEPFLDTDTLRAEAEIATISIARLLAPLDRDQATATIRDIMTTTERDATRERGQLALDWITSLAGYLTDWQTAGPYAAEGCDYDCVFEYAFAPEQPDPGPIKWQALALTSNEKPWIFDLSRSSCGNCCVYVRTKVWTATSQPAQLAIGSDDGVKAWLNNELIHTNPATRGHEPLSDRLAIELQPGWNHIMLKIAQAGGGWGFSAALQNPAGEPLQDLRYPEE